VSGRYDICAKFLPSHEDLLKFLTENSQVDGIRETNPLFTEDHERNLFLGNSRRTTGPQTCATE